MIKPQFKMSVEEWRALIASANTVHIAYYSIHYIKLPKQERERRGEKTDDMGRNF